MHIRHRGWKRPLAALVLGAVYAWVPATARAHFVLETPASWSVLDQTSGLPEKLGPCGNEGPTTLTLDDAGAPIVTAFQEGGEITITINEVVFHPGHYRIALSTDWADAGDVGEAGFPDEPIVTPGNTNSGTVECQPGYMSSCGTVPIVQHTPVAVPGVGWILADDVFEHCDPFTTPQTITVALPAGVTCNECVLQVIEYMSAHGLNVPGGCFYHHCANISISSLNVPVDGGGPGSGGAHGSSGGGCSVLPHRASLGAAGLAGLGLATWLVRRRRR
jgi:hypothetical protein